MSRNAVLFFRLALCSAMIIILYLTTTPAEYSIANKISDKLSHGLAFFSLAMLADFSFPLGRFNWKKVCPLFAYGVLIECIQYFLPYRDFSLLDIVADTLGLVVYPLFVPVMMYLPWLKQRWINSG